MQIIIYQTIMNRTRISSLKKLSNRTLTKSLIERTELKLKSNRTPNKLRILNFSCRLCMN
jgi:hypothetical protein